MRWMLCLPLAALAAAAVAHGAQRTPCDSCETCSQALAVAGAEVELKADLQSDGGTCVTLAGEGATFNGFGHSITARGTAIAVTGPDALVRQPRIRGAAVGIAIQAPRATIYDADVSGGPVGLWADGAPELRVERGVFEASQVGLALGPTASTCAPGASLRSPGAVVFQAELRGADVGLAACEARPVLVDVTARENRVGILLGDPAPAGTGPGAQAPFDPCACAPSLDAIEPGTTLLFSSGCGGCEIHEGFLPDVRARGHAVRLRRTGAAHQAETERFDRFVRRCAPGIIDAIGVPGCVPNYACLANAARFKRKGQDGRLVFEHRLNDADAVSEFAARCASEAAAHYDPAPGCVRHAVRGLKACGNREAGLIVSGAPPAGTDNACGGGALPAGLGCTAPCAGEGSAPAAPATHASAAPAASAAPVKPATPPAAGPSLVAPDPAAPPRPVNPEHHDRPAPPWILWAGVAILVGGAGFFLLRRKAP